MSLVPFRRFSHSEVVLEELCTKSVTHLITVARHRAGATERREVLFLLTVSQVHPYQQERSHLSHANEEARAGIRDGQVQSEHTQPCLGADFPSRTHLWYSLPHQNSLESELWGSSCLQKVPSLECPEMCFRSPGCFLGQPNQQSRLATTLCS